ncbi:MAG: riboflavin biosynthesis protein RibD [Candidatus Magasanikbacteria bacterium CG10_big_fil_rev_8_21_14_0_10_43_6]|uniref:Riboflavin biosynthesis protein RibD n=1 Tax=Candidatus Magasanikbacteria bacterium CG10_big_fil_rev_8_21_14_0_10_43_6 TaxID=1974650 RepID=A0A2M6W2J1_9BACT|nr:MAG: riboflavin biosynthesis protein RibD [Candidatus Magasanikbacteria bacterium CG10_big_fil_rev_8_21_14_0_10_43_6]
MEDQYIEQAITLAKKSVGLTTPNPNVGALFVRGGVIIGKGYHKGAGKDHAEIMAAKDAQKNGYDLVGATLYTTLEPCLHYGKTPPCADFLLEAQVAKVVIGMKDVFRLVNGGGIKKLQRAGVEVELLSTHASHYKDIQLLNQPFIKWATTGLPYVTLKAATTLDGKIATRTGDSKWITSQEARKDARIERSLADAVLVGAGTVRADNPELAPHGRYAKKKLLRVVLDGSLLLPISKQVFRDQDVFVATTDQASKIKKAQYQKKGIKVISFGKKNISIKKLLQYLGKKEVQHVYIEGGAAVHGSFYDEALSDPLVVDRVVWYINPSIIGGVDALSAVGGKGVASVDERIVLRHREISDIGGDIKIEGHINIY